MRLVEGNKELNRRFHDMPQGQRLEFLLQGYGQVMAQPGSPQAGEFTPRTVDAAAIPGLNTRSVQSAQNTVNFFMSRLNMLHDPSHESKIQDLCLKWWEYNFVIAESNDTRDVQLITNFFSKRGKPEMIRPVLEEIAESLVDYDHALEPVLDHALFHVHVGQYATQVYRLRMRLHALMDGQNYTKDQAAAALIDEGFNLKALDFNQCYAAEKDYEIKQGRKAYKEKEKDKEWLETFLATPKEQRGQRKPAKEKKSESEEDAVSKKPLEKLAKGIEAVLGKGKKPHYMVQCLAALTQDHAELTIDPDNTVETKIWEKLWQGNFFGIPYEVRRTEGMSGTYDGMKYIRWALHQPEHTTGMNSVLLQNAYSMLICAELVLYRSDSADALLSSNALKGFHNEEKIKAAMNLAFRVLLDPIEGEDPKEYTPGHGYLLHLAKKFGTYLADNPDAQPYLSLLQSPKKLTKLEKTILAETVDTAVIKDIYTARGMQNKIQAQYKKVFDATLAHETEFTSLYTSIRHLENIVSDATFREYVDDGTLRTWMAEAVHNVLSRKNRHDEDADQHGTRKFVVALYESSVLQPYLEGTKRKEMIEGMIEEIVERKRDLYAEPLSLMHQGDVFFMDSSNALEAYMIADKYRQEIAPEKMQDLVTCLLGLCAEQTAGSDIVHAAFSFDQDARREDPTYTTPYYFPNFADDTINMQVDFMTKLYVRESILGGLNPQTASTFVTNIVFRGTYVQPGRFYPHVDTMMDLLNSRAAALLPQQGPGADAIKEFRILQNFVREI